MKPLPHSFFDRPTLKVARELIGCFLVRKIGGKIERHMIIEVEAYDGFKDEASHASHGMTKRNQIMFKSAGHIYVYFTYGMHWMLNIVTGPLEYPAAVLIRGLESENGPARLTKKLKIDGALNGKMLSKKNGLWIEGRDASMKQPKIMRTARVGVLYAGKLWAEKKYRFVLKTESN